MAEVESHKYTDEHRDKKRVGAGKFNQPTEFHPDHVEGPPDNPSEKPPMYAKK